MPLCENAAVQGAVDIRKPIPVSQCSEYVTQMRRDKNAGFAKQYKVIKTTNKRLKFYFDFVSITKMPS